jgi:glutamyl/glutaminyl-tRNA synthetase
MRTRATSLVDLVEMLGPFFREDFPYDAAALEKFKKDSALPSLLQDFLPFLSELSSWDRQSLEAHFRTFAEQRGVKPGVLIHSIRLAITGRTGGPGLFELVEVMGKENTIARIRRFINELSVA